jgi:hypothetical protein
VTSEVPTAVNMMISAFCYVGPCILIKLIISLIGIVGDGVQLGPLGTAVTSGPIVRALSD